MVEAIGTEWLRLMEIHRQLIDSNGRAIAALGEKILEEREGTRLLAESQARALLALDSKVNHEQRIELSLIGSNAAAITDIIEVLKQLQSSQKMLSEIISEQHENFQDFKLIIESMCQWLNSNQQQTIQVLEVLRLLKDKIDRYANDDLPQNLE